MSADTLKKLRIFAASPSDVASERARLETVVASLKPTADYLGLTLEVVDWRDVVPDAGRPQQIIFDQLKPTSWDIFVGILWSRFGTPSGAKDPQTQKDYLSGTEEEFRVAYRLRKQYGKPRIMMYKCMRPIPHDADFVQAQRVKDFFKEIQDPQSEFRVLSQSFDTTVAFEKLLLDNLQKLLIEYGEHSKTPITPEVAQVLAPKIPDNLPRRAAFFGRKREMDKVLGALGPEERGWGVVIDGIGGIGKTALALEAAYRLKERGLFEAFIFASAKQKRLEPSGIKSEARAANTLDDFTNETARVLGQPGIAKLAGEDKRRALLDALRTTRALLIYDNLETLTKEEQEALADWLRFLPQGCKAILTSRRRGGEGALWLRLEKLEWKAAQAIIMNEARRDTRLADKLQAAGERRWLELYDETKGSPLALMHVLGLMRTRTMLTFDGALEMLRGNRDADLQRFIFEEARKELGAGDVTALRALSFFLPSASFEALMAVADLSRNALEMSLDRLDALSLLDKTEGVERYALHPLTRAFVHDELLADTNVARETGMRFATYWVDYAQQYGGWGGEKYKTFDRLEAEWLNLDAAANWLWGTAQVQGDSVGDRDAAGKLNDLARSLSQFLWYGGRWGEQARLSTWAFEAMWALNDWHQAGRRASEVSVIQHQRARTDAWACWTECCAEAWERGGEESDQAEAKRVRGFAARGCRDYVKAQQLFQAALESYRYLKKEKWVATVLNNLGELEYECKHYDVAERDFREALVLAEKDIDKDRQARIVGNLGTLALDCDLRSEARQWFEQEHTLAKEIGHIELIAHSKCGLARVHEAEGRADLALPLAQEALKIYERLQHRDLAEARELVERLRRKA